ncbi:ArsR family transcriptional regulator [Halobacteriales archaeon SW_7_71_33]|nr:MAG: ArsR family transcriptional regulator [Halobacteriales archaeon SW_7_71_33]
MSVWPPRPEPPTTSEEEPRVVDIDSEDAGPIFDALGSETARELLSLLYEEPRPASELAEAIGCSLPNVDYHLSKLETAELVEPVEEWYSQKGAEMTVYAPTGRSLVTVYRADEPTTTTPTTVPTAGSATPLLSPPDAVGLAFALGVVLAVAAVAVASRH